MPSPESQAETLRTIVRSLFVPETIVETAIPELLTGQLPLEEQHYIAGAVAARQMQFGTARTCARRALAAMGVDPCPLVPNPDRSPWWPAGIVGSIAHTERFCAVALARAHQVRSLGLDLEVDTGPRPELQEIICGPTEREWLSQFDRPDSGFLALLLFSAKEAFYKCQYTVTRTMLDFKDVELRVDLSAGHFAVANLRHDIPDRDRILRIEGRWHRMDDLVVTSALLHAGGHTIPQHHCPAALP